VGESGRGGKQKTKGAGRVCVYNNYKFFFALALTLLSNTVLRIGVCAVWNGFIAVCLPPLNTYSNKDEDTDLDVQLPEIVEERFDSVVVLCLVQDDKLHVYSIHKKARKRRNG
jgi:hypothetical protein